MPEPSPKDVRFIDSMPRPLIVAFLVFVFAGVGIVVWTFARPPSTRQVALELRRSPPIDSYTHNVIRARLVDFPVTLPAFRAPCPTVAGLIVEGGAAAQDRIRRALEPVCAKLEAGEFSPEVIRALRALSTAKIRFALFTRTGDLSTADLTAGRILLAVALSRTNVPVGLIAPLLVHEGYHLSAGEPVTAAQEFAARRAEYEACKMLIELDRFPRGCDDARAMVRLGEARAVELLVRAGYPR